MPLMRFSKLSLLSRNERSGYAVDFTAPKTVLVGGNGYGKSAILKSLYETLGAQPRKVDQSWLDAKVQSLLQFEVDGARYAALRIDKNYTLFDGRKEVLLSTERISNELAPALAQLLNFKLVLADRQDQIRVPPPSYAFAPFYSDQDASWSKPWDAFKDLQMFPNSIKSMAEYHSGLRPNAYYEAKSERDLKKVDLQRIHVEREAVAQAFRRLRETMPVSGLVLDLEQFEKETNQLLAEATHLRDQEAKYRAELVALNEEIHAWQSHVELLQSAIKEQDQTLVAMGKESDDVECPLCGQHYTNGINERFELTAERDDLVVALQTGKSKLIISSDQFRAYRSEIAGIQNALTKVDEILAVKKQDVSLRDVIASEGRTEALRFLSDRLAALDSDFASKQREVDDAEQRMKEADNPRRRREIYHFFNCRLAEAAMELDVRPPGAAASLLQGVRIGRGSEGPRALVAYYYAFLQTAHEYSTSAFCPIVIDAPNQQGQDTFHLEAVMTFLLSNLPSDAQVIVGAEAVSTEASKGAVVKDVTYKKNQVLREDQYESVSAEMRPYLEQLSH